MPVTTWAATRVGLCIGELALEHDENRGAERDQCVGPQSREALAPLPLEADGAAKQNGDDQIKGVVPERGIEYRRHRFLFNFEPIARRSHGRENAPARKNIGREAGCGRRRPDVGLPRELVKHIRLKRAF